MYATRSTLETRNLSLFFLDSEASLLTDNNGMVLLGFLPSQEPPSHTNDLQILISCVMILDSVIKPLFESVPQNQKVRGISCQT